MLINLKTKGCVFHRSRGLLVFGFWVNGVMRWVRGFVSLVSESQTSGNDHWGLTHISWLR